MSVIGELIKESTESRDVFAIGFVEWIRQECSKSNLRFRKPGSVYDQRTGKELPIGMVLRNYKDYLLSCQT